MKTINLLLAGISIILLTLYACEEDDVCIDGTTPQLMVKFEKVGTTVMDSLFIYRQNADGSFTTINNGNVMDSLGISLRIDKTQQTKLIFSTRTNNPEKADTLDFHYNYSTEFVSKACGYKVLYSNIKVTQNTHHFIQKVKVLKENITDETSSHIVLEYK